MSASTRGGTTRGGTSSPRTSVASASTKATAERQAAAQRLAALLHQQSPRPPAGRFAAPSQLPSPPSASARATAPPSSRLAAKAALLRCVRHSHAYALQRALGRWWARAVTPVVAVARPARVTAGRRAGHAEAALAEMKAERDGLQALLEERDREVARARRQLTQESERRRLHQKSGGQAQAELGRLRHGAEQQRVAEEAVGAARAAEATWRGEAMRAARELALVARELRAEEATAASARRLVVACHTGLLEAEQQTRLTARQQASAQQHSLDHATAMQKTLAAELAAAAKAMSRAAADHRGALEAARAKAAAAAEEVRTLSTSEQLARRKCNDLAKKLEAERQRRDGAEATAAAAAARAPPAKTPRTAARPVASPVQASPPRPSVRYSGRVF